ncbi:hypothetical protein COB55_03510 [Candidatus Wolfebacteria bacterium]|nr:MAG: hypothetical protein COB55_03510 [Candidatus Wolfebacteria bacterium]
MKKIIITEQQFKVLVESIVMEVDSREEVIEKWEKEKKMEDWFVKLLNNLEERSYHGDTYYINEETNEIYIYYDKDNNKLRINTDKMWKPLKSMFNVNFNDVGGIYKRLIGEYLNLWNVRPVPFDPDYLNLWQHNIKEEDFGSNVLQNIKDPSKPTRVRDFEGLDTGYATYKVGMLGLKDLNREIEYSLHWDNINNSKKYKQDDKPAYKYAFDWLDKNGYQHTESIRGKNPIPFIKPHEGLGITDKKGKVLLPSTSVDKGEQYISQIWWENISKEGLNMLDGVITTDEDKSYLFGGCYLFIFK